MAPLAGYFSHDDKGQGPIYLEDHVFPQSVTSQWYTSDGSQRRKRLRSWSILALACLTLFVGLRWHCHPTTSDEPTPVADAAWEDQLAKCSAAVVRPGMPDDFYQRQTSDRFVPGTAPLLITNATIWTGADDGKQVLKSTDVFVHGGIIKRVGQLLHSDLAPDGHIDGVKVQKVDAQGAWLTPGLVDLHSHLGVYPLPLLSATEDGNSEKKPILPELRSLDGFNYHDVALHSVVSGGVTTSLVLPGSANNIGGQAFPIKLRPVDTQVPSSMVIDPPATLVLPGGARGRPGAWRHMKMACGENIRRVYDETRMDEAWSFRSSFEKARKIMQAQDEYCERALSAHKKGKQLSDKFPEDFQWEALVDVLRGRVKVNTHCYTESQLDNFIRHTNEFKFPLAAFHHAHEAFRIPDTLKKVWGGTPAVAMFSTNGRYKREAWWGSEFAPALLAAQNITPILKSDHPVLDSRRLLYQAGQSHHFSLTEEDALRAVTIAPADALGFGYRLGRVKEGFDGDLVLWNTHPLRLGAEPKQVWIDGIAQLDDAHTPSAGFDLTADAPKQGDFAKELGLAGNFSAVPKSFDGEIVPETTVAKRVVFKNVGKIFSSSGLQHSASSKEEDLSVVVEDGIVSCVGDCPSALEKAVVIDLRGGYILPGLTSFGATLGLADIASEAETSDGEPFDPFSAGGAPAPSPEIGGLATMGTVKAADGLLWGGKNMKIAYRSGVTRGIVAPEWSGSFSGVSASFKTGALHALDDDAILSDSVALNFALRHSDHPPSISAQIGLLRRLLLSESQHRHGADGPNYFHLAGQGKLPLVVAVDRADHMATLIRLKKDVEAHTGKTLKLVFLGAAEGHLLAHKIAEAGISAIVAPRSFVQSWDQRRSLLGPPLTGETLISALTKAGVTVAIGISEDWEARNLIWDAAWAARDTNSLLGESEAVALLSSNFDQIFGLNGSNGVVADEKADFVAYDGSPFEFGAKVVAISDSKKGVEIF